MRVGIFEIPASGLDVGAILGPVGRLAALFFEQPLDGGDRDGRLGIDACFGEGVEGDAGVPDGGEAGLNADEFGVGGPFGGGGSRRTFLGIVGGIVGVIDEEVFEECFWASSTSRVIVGITRARQKTMRI